MMKVVRGLPVSLVLVIVSACHVKVSCGSGDLGDDDGSELTKVSTSANMTGIAIVTASTHPEIKADMRCKLSLDKKPSKDQATATISCFPHDDSGSVVYSGTSTTFTYEPREATDSDDRLLYIDESAAVRAKLEYDGTKTPAGSFVVWSPDAAGGAWEIKGEAR